MRKKRSGRKLGRTEPYNLAIKDYFNGEGKISELARKYNINRTGLSLAINSAKKINCVGVGEVELKEFAENTKETILNGLANLEILKDSDDEIHNVVADIIVEEIKNASLKNSKYIQAIGTKLLRDLDKEINALREQNALNIVKLNQCFRVLETASRTLGMPKQPLVAIQNNFNNEKKETTKDKDLNVNINFVESRENKIIDLNAIEKEEE